LLYFRLTELKVGSKLNQIERTLRTLCAHPSSDSPQGEPETTMPLISGKTKTVLGNWQLAHPTILSGNLYMAVRSETNFSLGRRKKYRIIVKMTYGGTGLTHKRY
jgi:hypothetical protein